MLAFLSKIQVLPVFSEHRTEDQFLSCQIIRLGHLLPGTKFRLRAIASELLVSHFHRKTALIKSEHSTVSHFLCSNCDYRQKLSAHMLYDLESIRSYVQQRTNIQERLLNKPYVNKVTLSEQNPPLKCC